jgi:hypothetical protein
MSGERALLERYAAKIAGVLGCYDRIVLSGTLSALAYPKAMAGELRRAGVRCFDLEQFVEPLRQEIHANAKRLAAENGLTITNLRGSRARKEDLVAPLLAQRKGRPGLVCIFSTMESCTAYKPWYDKASGRTGLRFRTGQCAHYYFYFLDEELGPGYVRVPTWAPYRLQVYFNGHHWLARRLARARLTFRMDDNAFVALSDWGRAQALSDQLDVTTLHEKLDGFARRFCPPSARFGSGYHWSVMQIEYSLDVVFRRREDLRPLYQEISRHALLVAHAEQIARFWDKDLSRQAQVASRFSTRVTGTCVRHQLGVQWLKMYDRGGCILRLEATSNDITFFRHHRKVEHKDGTTEFKVAPLKKSIYSLPDLDGLMAAACRRYLEFIGTLEDRSPQRQNLESTQPPRAR